MVTVYLSYRLTSIVNHATGHNTQYHNTCKGRWLFYRSPQNWDIQLPSDSLTIAYDTECNVILGVKVLGTVALSMQY